MVEFFIAGIILGVGFTAIIISSIKKLWEVDYSCDEED